MAEEFTHNFDGAAFLTNWANAVDDSLNNRVDPTWQLGRLPSQVGVW